MPDPFLRPFTTAAYLFANRYSRGGIHRALRREVARLDAMEMSPRVLNVGAGGTFGREIGRLQRADLMTIDVDPARNPDAVMDVRHLDQFPDGTFDHVFMMEVLEHVETPQHAVDEIRRVLRPGGTLLLSAPMTLEVHDCCDYYRFTAQGLRWLLREFESVAIVPDTTFVQTMIVLVLRLCLSRHRIDRLISVLAMALLVVLLPLVWLLDRCIRTDALPKGLIATARK